MYLNNGTAMIKEKFCSLLQACATQSCATDHVIIASSNLNLLSESSNKKHCNNCDDSSARDGLRHVTDAIINVNICETTLEI